MHFSIGDTRLFHDERAPTALQAHAHMPTSGTKRYSATMSQNCHARCNGIRHAFAASRFAYHARNTDFAGFIYTDDELGGQNAFSTPMSFELATQSRKFPAAPQLPNADDQPRRTALEIYRYKCFTTRIKKVLEILALTISWVPPGYFVLIMAFNFRRRLSIMLSVSHELIRYINYLI